MGSLYFVHNHSGQGTLILEQSEHNMSYYEHSELLTNDSFHKKKQNGSKLFTSELLFSPLLWTAYFVKL